MLRPRPGRVKRRRMLRPVRASCEGSVRLVRLSDGGAATRARHSGAAHPQRSPRACSDVERTLSRW